MTGLDNHILTGVKAGSAWVYSSATKTRNLPCHPHSPQVCKPCLGAQSHGRFGSQCCLPMSLLQDLPALGTGTVFPEEVGLSTWEQ